MALKVDIKKAFDTIDWLFLYMVLHQFSFYPEFCTWIYVTLLYVRLSVLVNENTVGFYPCARGVRQGDPLSLLLFCLVEEVMRRSQILVHHNGSMVPMNYCQCFNIPAHVLYVDDVLIFCVDTKKNVLCMMKFFNDYIISLLQVNSSIRKK